MSDEGGWFKMHRKLSRNPRFNKAIYLGLWCRLLMLAAYSDRDVEWKEKRITLRPGQLTCGSKQLHALTGIKPNSIYRMLKKFEEDKMIKRETSNRCTLITVMNWNRYQDIVLKKQSENTDEPPKNDQKSDEELSSTCNENTNQNEKQESKNKPVTAGKISCDGLMMQSYNQNKSKTDQKQKKTKKEGKNIRSLDKDYVFISESDQDHLQKGKISSSKNNSKKHKIGFNRNENEFTEVAKDDLLGWLDLCPENFEVKHVVRQLNRAAVWMIDKKKYRKDYRPFLNTWMGNAKRGDGKE